MQLFEQFGIRLLVIWLHVVLWACAASGDDTAAIQALLDRPDSFGQVVLPAGNYECGPMTVPDSVRFVFGSPNDETTLTLKPNAGEWARMLTVAPRRDSTILIAGITFDLNRDNQNWQGGFDLAHQAAILLTGEHAGTGYLNATVRRCRFRDGAGDGIYQHHRVRLVASDLTMDNVFRAGFAVTGRDSTTVLTASTFRKCGLDVEPNNAADKLDVVVSDCEMSDFDIALTNGSRCLASNIKQTGGVLYLYGPPKSDFICRDSSFVGGFKVRLANGRFERCKFTGSGAGPVMSLQWAHNSVKTDLAFTLLDCRIDGPGSIGIDAGQDQPVNRNQLSMLGTAINGTTKGAAAQTNTAGREQRGLPWILTGSTHNGVPLK